ncbi:MAG: hypothetical protein DIU70_012865, partial [Bacillota bacterium]
MDEINLETKQEKRRQLTKRICPYKRYPRREGRCEPVRAGDNRLPPAKIGNGRQEPATTGETGKELRDPGGAGLIRFEAVNKYFGNLHVLKDINLSI